MPLRIQLSRYAQYDLEEIWLYTYTNWSIDQAHRYIDQINKKFSALSMNPSQGKKIELHDLNFYYILVNAHLIFYQFNMYEIYIIRILHKKMDIAKHLNP
jgi:toxin ParE1/3/4